MVSMFRGFLAKPAPSKPAPSEVAVTRRVESERSRRAATEKRDAERKVALAAARNLGVISQPMTPRAQIAAEVAAERAARRLA